ncbi:mitochondrial inner membrane magnesium ion transmembrane transporter Mrs2 [Schizosaccharomyces pombe]|uniref:Mitochondrial inner membrane magnesium transporter mrs2 n=1 Tax=Schizosaccharomyces pombe (strain 972 / ATCC 24843) TaxID=284812 RepID=MRS2_SCHPO|nr:putative magnesium ion transporter Mrs2 [Schizosaccharomyces pombe]P87149.1 RecName: Full=Mitochondrial inner membrane magnesium transporter mrs2; AltName: Full=RNA-splicing protein mrs2; Flags: Precursor [Schizosaccharomyces pombe 972h-]CAB08784.1 magnesium ion transporter Mrs2 (predicted) [Schizosaccharomyces pombe]|eukprot:NP_596358.1 putative magnesium ion transporter Mrs2 [Schizosaccharomyces pombe]
MVLIVGFNLRTSIASFSPICRSLFLFPKYRSRIIRPVVLLEKPFDKHFYATDSNPLITGFPETSKNCPPSVAATKNRLLMNCTEFDDHGNVRVISGDFKKMDLCKQNGLLPRDLRKLNTSINSIVPVILVREGSILINLLHIRALIKANSVLLFDVYGSQHSHSQSQFIYELEGRLKQKSSDFGWLPYEMRALETILVSVVNTLDSELHVLHNLVSDLLADFELDINQERLRTLLIFSKRLSGFLKKATLIRDVLDELLEQDQDLAGMYLTERLKTGKPRDLDKHDEVELLLETYCKQVDEIVQQTDNLVGNIRSTEEICNIMLDANRNSLMLLGLKLSAMTLGLGFGAVVASLYGMNLQNGLENHPYAFYITTGSIFAFAAFLSSLGILKIRRLKRIQMALYHRCNLPISLDPRSLRPPYL